MFGNAPRSLWERWCPADSQGRIELACRCFLLRDNSENILIEAGVGAFFSPELAERYGVTQQGHQLLESLEEVGLDADQIDRVYLSHLHFDHAGGILSSFAQGPLHLVFRRARYFVTDVAWQRAVSPHRRDRASYIPKLQQLLIESGRLEVMSTQVSRLKLKQTGVLPPSMDFSMSDGHSPGMSLFTFTGRRARAAFCADLIPGLPWLRTAITMGYDRFPERLIDEKLEFLHALGPGAVLLFTHDPLIAATQLEEKEVRGRLQLSSGLKIDAFRSWNLDYSDFPEPSGAL